MPNLVGRATHIRVDVGTNVSEIVVSAMEQSNTVRATPQNTTLINFLLETLVELADRPVLYGQGVDHIRNSPLFAALLRRVGAVPDPVEGRSSRSIEETLSYVSAQLLFDQPRLREFHLPEIVLGYVINLSTCSCGNPRPCILGDIALLEELCNAGLVSKKLLDEEQKMREKVAPSVQAP